MVLPYAQRGSRERPQLSFRKETMGMKNFAVNSMMMSEMRMMSVMCMLHHGENGHFLSETV